MKTWVVGAHGGAPCLGAHVACCLTGAQPGLRVGSTPRTPEVWVVVGCAPAEQEQTPLQFLTSPRMHCRSS